MQRDTIAHEKDTDGRVWILLDVDRTHHDTDRDTTGHRQDSKPDALISAKDETIAMLREQLQAERQAHGEARRIIAGLVERIPAIEAPQEETRESPQTGEGEPEGAEPRPDTPGTPEGSQRRSWWVAALLGLLLIVSVASLSFFVFLASG